MYIVCVAGLGVCTTRKASGDNVQINTRKEIKDTYCVIFAEDGYLISLPCDYPSTEQVEKICNGLYMKEIVTVNTLNLHVTGS